MAITKKLMGFMKTGKLNTYDLLKYYLLEGSDVEIVEELFGELSEREKREFILDVWGKLADENQKTRLALLYVENWERIIAGYHDLHEKYQLIRLEILGYIPRKEAVDFLLQEMKNQKESIRLTATTALKRQDTSLTIEPMFLALTRPDEWLPSRVYEVLKGVGPSLVPRILAMIEDVDIYAQQVMVQLLGELGDASCLPMLAKLSQSSDKLLRRRVVEALNMLKLKTSLPILLNLLEDNEWQIRMQAAEIIGILRTPEAIPSLEERKSLETDSIVKECILEALEKTEEAEIPVAVNWVRER